MDVFSNYTLIILGCDSPFFPTQQRHILILFIIIPVSIYIIYEVYIQNVFVSAFIPAPIYFGRIFDSQCLLWAPSCDGDGACLEYNTQTLPFALFGTCLGIKILTFGFLLLTYISSRYRNWTKDCSYDNAGRDARTETAPTTPETEISTISSVPPTYSLETTHF
jgi:hypothetical protein